jgi:polysaccharide export outer membrane protein
MVTNTTTRPAPMTSRHSGKVKSAFMGTIFSAALVQCSVVGIAQQRVQPVDPGNFQPPVNATSPALAASTGVQAAVNADSSAAPILAIGAGDLLQVTVFDTPELSAQLRVSQAGEIGLPWGPTLNVNGLTAEQAATAIERNLETQNILKYPHKVTVFVAEYATQGVKVLGQVKSPGVYPLLGTHRLYDLIASAGGVTDFASRRVLIIHQNDPLHPVAVELDYGPGQIQHSDIKVLPGDTVVVQKAGVVYVLGDVGRPGGFLIEDNQPLTVMRALSLAQGVNKTAKLNSTVIFRNTGAGQTESQLPLKKVLKGQSTDLALSDHDILYVPSSIEKTLGYRGIELAAQATAGVIIYK